MEGFENQNQNKKNNNWGKYAAIACLLGIGTYTLYPSYNKAEVDEMQGVTSLSGVSEGAELDEQMPEAEAATNLYGSTICNSGISRWKGTTAQNTQNSMYSYAGYNFIDKQFPPQASSLYTFGHMKPQDTMEARYRKVTQWTTPRNLVRNPSLWGNRGVLPAGVRQGELGDCWMLAAGASLAEHPSRLMKLFKETSYNSKGAFLLYFYDQGRQVSITVDDQLPLKYPGQLINTQMSKNGAWWMPILEKAYAKFNVSYGNLDAGTPLQSYRDLTGMPTVRHTSNTMYSSTLFRIINEADKKQWLMSAACMRSMQGLVPAHAYSLLGASEVTDSTGRTWRLMHMRNPWGKERYQGAWSDRDSRWNNNPHIKRQLKFNATQDGQMWMPKWTFKQAFAHFYVNMYQNWNVTRWSNTSNGNQFKKYFRASRSQEAIMTLDWIGSRKWPRNCGQYIPVHDYNIFVTDFSIRKRSQEGGFRDIGYAYHLFKGGLKQGHRYKVLIYDFKNKGQHDFTVTLYTAKSKEYFKRSYWEAR